MMELEYFNKIGINTFCNKTIYEKIDLLLQNNAFYVIEDDWMKFIEYVELIDTHNRRETDEHIIANIPYLKCNHDVLFEISMLVVSDLMDEYKPGYSIPGIEILDNYEALLLGTRNNDEKKELIEDTILEIILQIKDIPYSLNHTNFKADRNVNKKNLYFYIESYYQSCLCSEELNHNELIEIKEDVIQHVAFPSDTPRKDIYRTSLGFSIIHDLLNTLNYLKKELTHIEHKTTSLKDDYSTKYSIKNILDDYNRFPSVFKDALSCELFIYIFSRKTIKTNIIFSYYFDIFKENKHVKRNIKPILFLSFINNFFGLKEVRLRDNLSSKKVNFYLNEYLNFKKEFDKKINIDN